VLDQLFRGALVIDGTGAPPRVADVGVKDARIACIGKADDAAKYSQLLAQIKDAFRREFDAIRWEHGKHADALFAAWKAQV